MRVPFERDRDLIATPLLYVLPLLRGPHLKYPILIPGGPWAPYGNPRGGPFFIILFFIILIFFSYVS